VISPDTALVLAIGFGAGLLGGLLGLGGSVIIIPALTLLRGPNQHLYQAAAMIVNVVVAASATAKHSRAGTIRWDVARRMLPAAAIAIGVGVATSDRLDGPTLGRIFGVFLLYFAGTETLDLLRRRTSDAPGAERVGWPVLSLTGGVMGFLAGLLGIGAGIVTVPLLRRLGRLPLRQCIGTTSAVMLVTSTIGAIHKNTTITSHVGSGGIALRLEESLRLAALLAPTALVAAYLGAKLMYRLPLAVVRVALVLLIVIAALRMTGVISV